MPDGEQLGYVLIEAENLLLDVAALSLAVCRAEVGIKIPQQLLSEFDGRALKNVIPILLASTIPEIDLHNLKSLVDKILNTIMNQADLIRPFFGAPAFLRDVVLHFHLRPLLLTRNPQLILSALCSNKSKISLMHFADPNWTCPESYSVLESNIEDIQKVKPLGLSARSFSNGGVDDEIFVIGETDIVHTLPSFEKLLTQQALVCTSKFFHSLSSTYSSLPIQYSMHEALVVARDLFFSDQHIAKSIQTGQTDNRLPTTIYAIDWAFLSDSDSDKKRTSRYPDKVQPLKVSYPMCPERLLWDAAHLIPISVFEGRVVKGFGRGSTELGIPTSNLDNNEPINKTALPFPGIYFGVAKFLDSFHTQNELEYYDIVMSSGYNPYYDNSNLTIEPYLFHDFYDQFYGAKLRIVVIGVLRPESNYSKYEHLIQAIQNDCEAAKCNLSQIKKNRIFFQKCLEYLKS